MIPRPVGEAMYGTTSSGGLEFDYLSMHSLNTKSNHTVAYVLTLNDDLFGFLELIPFGSPGHFVVADALMDWYK